MIFATKETNYNINKIVEQLLESIPSDEIASQLGLMLENYVLNAPVSRVELANAVSITTLLISTVTALEQNLSKCNNPLKSEPVFTRTFFN